MQKSPPIAIVGMSSLFAGSHDVLGFWRDIVSATDRITDVPPHNWLIDDYYSPDPTAPDMTYAKRGGYLDPLPFNPMEYGLPPKTIPSTDSAQLIALVAAKRVLADAGRFHDGDVDHSRTSVILGVASATGLVVEAGSRLQHPVWRKALREAGLPESQVQEIIQRIKDHYQPWQESTFPGLLGNVDCGADREPPEPRWFELRDGRRVRELDLCTSGGSPLSCTSATATWCSRGVWTRSTTS